MTDEARHEHNAALIPQLWPPLRPKIEAILRDMEGHGWRPRIQVAYRSEAEQLRCYRRGTSNVDWGLHCAATSGGTPDALACDIIEEGVLYNTTEEWERQLESSARSHGLETGRPWRRPHDPWHVQWPGLDLKQTRKGARPHVEGYRPTR